METKTKKCPRCGRTLQVEEFYKDARKKGGLSCYCKSCQKEFSRVSWGRNRNLKKEIEDLTKEKKALVDQTSEMARRIELMESLAKIKPAEELTAAEMVERLRTAGWEVTCRRTVTEEL